MSRSDKRRLYNLIPSIYHQRDRLLQQTPNGHRPLQDLTAIMEETLKILENDIEGLYENWFIETCNEWAAPYIGDLVDANLLRSVKEGATVSGKAYVANTIHYRKRKGTIAILEEIARDVTGWDAHVVEFFQLLSTTQNINHKRIENRCTPNITDPEPMGLVGTAFDPIPHTLDVRHIKNGHGYYNVANVGIFLWRLAAYPIRRARAFWHGEGKYSFSSTGMDLPLFNHTRNNSDDILSKEIDISGPIRREVAKKYLHLYYGENKILLLEDETDGIIKEDRIIICDLSDLDGTGKWHEPAEFSSDFSSGKVALDPVLGRILFSDRVEHKIFVSYYYGFSADMGGGFYRRDLYESGIDNIEKYQISEKYPPSDDTDCYSTKFRSINQALIHWCQHGKPNAVFEIVDSGIYNENISSIDIPKGTTLILRSAQEQRATIAAKQNNEIHNLTISIGEKSRFVLDGLMMNNNLRLEVINKDSNIDESNVKTLVIHHCSLIPSTGADDSIAVKDNNSLTVILNKSICGKISMYNSMSQLVLKDTIVDKGPNGEFAVQCFEASLENSTLFGKSYFDMLTFASNVIFTDTVKVKRRQEGCVRFSYIAHRFEQGTSASKTPRCYRCQPKDADSNFVPQFTSEKYGAPGYAQLHKYNNKELYEGADNESEIGVFNQVYQSHRITNLLATFAEYLPFKLEAGIILVT
ncbi:MAG: hypothetical protein LBH74_01300 [Nitrososphaerota archaeon]|jgi:hypothetical protein|nr:hypothetical protein [Nitrososphaerota archaeon]